MDEQLNVLLRSIRPSTMASILGDLTDTRLNIGPVKPETLDLVIDYTFNQLAHNQGVPMALEMIQCHN
jgi:hypothetical protein